MANIRYGCAALFLLLLSLPALLPSIEAMKAEAANRPFSFLQNMQGCHKGETGERINQLRGYMKRFGYLKSNGPNSGNHEFDDRLEEAVKAYQRNFHLSVTGTLDAPTLEKMMAPRCGVPDIVNGTNHMLRSNGHWVGYSALRAGVHYSFFPDYPRWPKYDLTYKFVNNFLDPSIRDVAAEAFATWARVSSFRFRLVGSMSTADITIGGFSGNHGDGYSFDGPGGVLAHAFAPTDGRFHLDSQENWSTNPNWLQFDLLTIFIHEIGHLLGLGHSHVPQAVMYPTVYSGTTNRNLDGDDIAGIQALYP